MSLGGNARARFLCDAERCIECNACVTACKNENEVFIIGGAEIYEVFLKKATKMILSLVDTEVEFADAFFPDFEKENWEVVRQSKFIKEENDDFPYKIVTFRKLIK